MYKCEDCGRLIEEGDEAIFSECIGEYCGSPSYIEYSQCPICGGNIFEVERCPICDEYAIKDEEKFCKTCIEKIETQFKKLLEENFNNEERELISEMGVYWI